jgi:electron transfer flavoprotein alpha subunit
MNKILIVAEHSGGKLNTSTAKCVTCARGIPDAEITVAVLAVDGAEVARQAAALDGVSKVLVLDNPANEPPLAAVLAPQLAALAAGTACVFGPSTTFGKDLMPRVAALLGVPQLSEIMAVESASRFRRPVYAGNAVVTVETEAGRQIVCTVRVASFEATGTRAELAPIEAASVAAELPSHTRLVSVSAAENDRPDLQTAARVIAGGRALGSQEKFKAIFDLAAKLGAAVGATRAAVDAGYVSNELQVGQTGKIIAPELYIAVGISGAIQHVTGIKDAGTIVAINKDSEAPIFEVADYGLVGDLFTVLPELDKLL